MRSLVIRVIGLELMIKEISHDQIVQVVLVSVMALIENDQSDFLHFNEPVHQQVVEFLSHRHKDVVLSELFTPSIKL